MIQEQNGITFNSYKTSSKKFSVNPLTLPNQIGPDEDGGIVNAVDIDWNGAVLPQSDISNGGSLTINTSGEFFSGTLRGS